ncbi:NAD(P)/FAD-dependent oxidoreductase [Candidatus Margulisiibacteriota bacterium]
MQKTIIIIGAGPAGLMAAGIAAENGAKVTVLEKMDQPGKKLLITGKGRCNLTNIAERNDFLAKFNHPRFLKPAFYQFFNIDLINFFKENGLELKTERGGRVFPKADNSSSVLSILLSWLKKLNVKIEYHKKVTALLIKNNNIIGVKVNNKEYLANAVIIATGGSSYPATGSTGDGYTLAKNAGHTIIPIKPALVPLETEGSTAKKLQGLSLKNIKINIWINNKKAKDYFGEMLFTHFGLSGPIILSASNIIVPALMQKQNVVVSIDLKQALDEKTLDIRLQREFQENHKKQFKSILKNLLPAKLIPICFAQTKIDAEKPGHQISAQERRILRLWLKDFKFKIINYRPLKEAIITAGGIDLKEVNPNTMESKILKNLYFAGEVLNIDAETGGYNLQAAFSTGWLAGKNS